MDYDKDVTGQAAEVIGDYLDALYDAKLDLVRDFWDLGDTQDVEDITSDIDSFFKKITAGENGLMKYWKELNGHAKQGAA